MINASDTSSLEATAPGVAVGVSIAGVAAGAGVAQSIVDNAVAAFVDGGQVTATAGTISVLGTASNATVHANAIAVAVSISFGGAFVGANATATIDSTVDAYVRNATLTANGLVRVHGESVLHADADANGGAGSALVGIAVMVPFATVGGRTSAWVAGAVTVQATGLEVSAHGDHDATADSVSIGIGALGGAGAGGTASITRITEAAVGTVTGPAATSSRRRRRRAHRLGRCHVERATINLQGGAAGALAGVVLIGTAEVAATTRAYVGQGAPSTPTPPR